MASETSPKVRLVKCPKCLKVLPEVEDVPVYQCGGCFTILQAKKRSISGNGTSSAPVTEDTAQDSESQPVSEYKGSSSSSPDLPLPSSGEFLPKKEYEKYEKGQTQIGLADSISKQLNGVKLSDGDQTGEIQQSSATSHGDYNLNEENSGIEANGEIVAVDTEVSSDVRRSLSSDDQDQPVPIEGSTLSVGGNWGQEEYNQPCSEIVITSPDEEEQNQRQHYQGHPHMESTDDSPNGDFLANENSCAYYGSESSSSDEMEDQIPDSQIHASPSTKENERSVASEEKLRKGKHHMHGLSGYKGQGTSKSAVLSEETNNKWAWTRSLHLGGHPRSRNWRRHGTNEFLSHPPFYHRGPSFSGAYESGSPSYASHDEFHSHLPVYSLQMPPYGGGSRSGLNFIPAYNEQEVLDRMYPDVSYARQIGGRSWGQTSGFSGIPFSGEAVMNTRHRLGHSGLYSGQLHSFHSSYPGSPQRHIKPPGYYPGRSREIVSDVEDHYRRTSRELLMYMRERQPVAKRHVRPVAGGAPIVICYCCLATLQLPVDFLIFKRKHHLLRCSACKNVLRFSLQDTTHLVPAVLEMQTKLCCNMDANRNDYSASGSCRSEIPTKPEKMSSTSKNGKPPLAKGSPLHRLMGYTSVSQVFKVSRRPPSLRISDYDPTSK